jgi:hypothetical protein
MCVTKRKHYQQRLAYCIYQTRTNKDTDRAWASVTGKITKAENLASGRINRKKKECEHGIKHR